MSVSRISSSSAIRRFCVVFTPTCEPAFCPRPLRSHADPHRCFARSHNLSQDELPYLKIPLCVSHALAHIESRPQRTELTPSCLTVTRSSSSRPKLTVATKSASSSPSRPSTPPGKSSCSFSSSRRALTECPCARAGLDRRDSRRSRLAMKECHPLLRGLRLPWVARRASKERRR